MYLKWEQGDATTIFLTVVTNAAYYGKLQYGKNIIDHFVVDTTGSFWIDTDAVDMIRSPAAKGGYISILEYTSQTAASNLPWPLDIIGIAVHSLQLDVIQWLLQKTDCVSVMEHCTKPASKEDLASLRCLRDNGCPWDGYLCLLFASGVGHLPVAQYCVEEQSVALNDLVTSNSAMNGHLQVLKWARQNDCPWDSTKCRADAERKGHAEVVNWIDEQP